MKQFFKFVLATIVGIILSTVVIVLVIIGIVAAAGSDKDVTVDANSILHINLKYPITERTPNNPLANLSFLGLDGDKSIGLKDILANIKKAKRNIKYTLYLL